MIQLLTVHSLMVIELRIGTQNLESVYAGVFKAEKMDLRGGKSSTNFL